jgi:preprotein translocase subunit SecF
VVIGFAKVLLVAVVVSMFSAIIVTRTFLRLLVGTRLARNLWVFGAEAARPAAEAAAVPDGGPLRRERPRPFMLDFVGRRGFYYLLSLGILLPGIISLLIAPSLKPGIEFSAGTTFTLEFQDPTVDVGDVRSAFADLGHDEARVQKTTGGGFIIRLGELSGIGLTPPVGPAPLSERDRIETGLREGLGDFRVRNFASVSEIVSKEIGRNAAIAVGAAAVAILAYITFSFRRVQKSWRYGLAAIIAVIHDALFILGAYSILGKAFDMEVNTMFITALLTIIGFSVHDTIVVFDRIRENVARSPGVSFDEVVNASLTETLARSLNTSVTLVFTIAALLLLGGVTIQSFLIVLLLGVVAGTYSSIFIASQVLVSWEYDDLGRLLKRIFPLLRAPEGEAEV